MNLPHAPNASDTLIIGIAVVDAVAMPVDRFPAPGGLRFFDDLTFTTGGNAVNCSIALAKLGVPVDVLARVGADQLGDFIVSELRRHGVSPAHLIRDPSRSTSFSFVCVPSDGERSFLHTTGANATLRADDAAPALLAGKKLVFVTGAMLMDALDGEPAVALLRDAHAAGARTLLDTVYVESATPAEWRRRVVPALRLLDYFVPSEPEALALTGEVDPSRMARSLQREGAANVVIKLGARGVLCLDAAGRETVVPAFPVSTVVDTTGAGDCWGAGFLMGLREGRSMEDAARLGNAVAAVSIRACGATTALRSVEQVLELLNG